MNTSLLKKFACKNSYFSVFFIGVLTAFFIFLPFLVFDKGLFLYYGDYDVQQIPFYRLAHDAVREGNMLWNWNTDLGVNFIGSYSFYLLGSPFFWLTLPFPSEAVPYLMAPLYMLKFGLISVTGFAFIKRFTSTEKMAMLGGLLYAFSGFNIYNIFFNHFHEAVLVFPLLLIALEELVVNNQRGGFALAVALCAFTNYYFFFGQVFFVILYFFIRCTSKDFKPKLRHYFIIALEAVLGLLLSAFLLLPSVLAIMGNPRTGDMLNGFDLLFYNNTQRYGLIFSSFFFPPDIPARPNFFPDSNAKWSSVSMFLPMVSMTGVIAFFKGNKKHWAKTLLIASYIICFIPMLNQLFSGMNYNYYARWFYMPLLIMAMVTCIAFEKHMEHMKSGIIATSIIVGSISLIGILPKKVDDKLVFFQLPKYPERFWGYVAIAVIGLMIVGILYLLTTKYKHFFRVAVSSFMVITILTASFMIFLGKLAGEGYSVVKEQAIDGRENVNLADDSFFRIDTYDELDNLGMHMNIPTINAFHSIVPPSVIDYYQTIGQERGVGSRPKPQAIGIRGLMSVKYSFQKLSKGEKTELIGFTPFDKQNGYQIFKNEYFIPMGFTYDYFINKHQLDSYSGDMKDRLMLKGLLLEDKDYQKYKDYMPMLEDRYCYTDTLTDDDYYAACKERAATAAYLFQRDNKGFSAKINTKNKELVFFSVPYDEGWKAFVNGKQVEIVKANAGFMAVAVPKGNTDIRFDYHTPGAVMGWIITIASAALLFVYWLFIRYLRHKYPDKYYYDRFRHVLNRQEPTELLSEEAYMNHIIECMDE
ncbi:YfhO family protein [Paludicola sp. MB14-C6]|uniref:YfhO family protein n=1 Tax=Paludihabitans sp. MB14-C6 TaxID=3070656 RepID=UPI0027DCB7A4|nr:YfhO family protein [Paludicola sp. MB14-C6]WMJ24003.1 YfhO family protein [Paludicola sp. MB14-C6]